MAQCKHGYENNQNCVNCKLENLEFIIKEHHKILLKEINKPRFSFKIWLAKRLGATDEEIEDSSIGV